MIITDVTGDVFSGSSARTASSRNSHGSDRNRSMPAVTMRSQRPPRYPAAPPISAGDQSGEQRRGGRQQQRNARAVEQPRKTVAPQFVGSQPKLGGWRRADDVAKLFGIRVRAMNSRPLTKRPRHSQNHQRELLFPLSRRRAPGFRLPSRQRNVGQAVDDQCHQRDQNRDGNQQRQVAIQSRAPRQLPDARACRKLLRSGWMRRRPGSPRFLPGPPVAVPPG